MPVKLFRLERISEDCVEFKIRAWTVRAWLRLRISMLNNTEFSVARPGLGGHFRLSYAYQFQLPLVGSGPATIRHAIENSQNQMGEFRKSEIMIGQTVLGINAARKMLLERKDQ